MSFTSDIKSELCKLRIRQRDHQLSVLAGLTQTCGTLLLARNPELYYQSESLPVINLISSLAGQLYQLEPVISIKKQEHRRNPLSVVTVRGSTCRDLLLDTGILTYDADGLTLGKHIPDNLISEDPLRKCFMRGCFLGSGSCSTPESNYHLEISVRSYEFAESLAAVTSVFRLKARSTLRRGRPVMYLKGDDVSGFLAMIGASAAALKFEEVRAVKDYRNYINRTSNCETANIDKAVTAGLLQLRAIETIEEHMTLSKLPAPLYEAAMLRLQHPEATLQELADIAEIGKSGMNHRFSRLIAIAEEYGDNRHE